MFSYSKKFQEMSTPNQLLTAIAHAKQTPSTQPTSKALSADVQQLTQFYVQLIQRGGHIGC